MSGPRRIPAPDVKRWLRPAERGGTGGAVEVDCRWGLVEV